MFPKWVHVYVDRGPISSRKWLLRTKQPLVAKTVPCVLFFASKSKCWRVPGVNPCSRKRQSKQSRATKRKMLPECVKLKKITFHEKVSESIIIEHSGGHMHRKKMKRYQVSMVNGIIKIVFQQNTSTPSVDVFTQKFRKIMDSEADRKLITKGAKLLWHYHVAVHVH